MFKSCVHSMIYDINIHLTWNVLDFSFIPQLIFCLFFRPTFSKQIYQIDETLNCCCIWPVHERR